MQTNEQARSANARAGRSSVLSPLFEACELVNDLRDMINASVLVVIGLVEGGPLPDKDGGALLRIFETESKMVEQLDVFLSQAHDAARREHVGQLIPGPPTSARRQTIPPTPDSPPLRSSSGDDEDEASSSHAIGA